MQSPVLTIAGRTFASRLLIGTGKYPSLEVTGRAFEAAAPAMVTVAVRRVDLSRKGEGSVLDLIEAQRLPILPNTAGCYTAEEAVRAARLAREAGLSEFIKLEVIGDDE